MLFKLSKKGKINRVPDRTKQTDRSGATVTSAPYYAPSNFFKKSTAIIERNEKRDSEFRNFLYRHFVFKAMFIHTHNI